MEFTPIYKSADNCRYVNASQDGNRIYFRVNGATVDSTADDGEMTFKFSDEGSVKFAQWDESVVKAAVENKGEWFGRDTVRDATIQRAFQETVDDDGIASFEFASDDNGSCAKFFDADFAQVDEVTPGNYVDVFFEFAGMWFLRKQFGAVYKIVQTIQKNEDAADADEVAAQSSYPDACMFEENNIGAE